MAKPSRVVGFIARSPAVVHRAENETAPNAPDLPDLAGVKMRLAAAKGRSRPWLTAAAREAASDMPEIVGPKTYRKG